MKVIIWWNSSEAQQVSERVQRVLEDLGLSEFIELEMWADEALKQELSISQESALIIEEESIGFKDMIFEGIIPEEEELKSMFYSIIGGGSEAGGCNGCSGGSCGSGGCSSC